MDNFNISHSIIKTIIEVNDFKIAQQRIDEGWYLLNVGFRTNQQYSESVYILGNTEKIIASNVKIKTLNFNQQKD